MKKKSLFFYVSTLMPKARQARTDAGAFRWHPVKDVKVVIDEEDWPLIKDMGWHVYIKNGKPAAVMAGTITLQRIIFQEKNIPLRHDVFHKDGDPLNNTKENLVLCRTFRGKSIGVKHNAI